MRVLSWSPLFAFLLPSAAVAETANPPLAPGYGNLGYALPAPGSYALPSLGRAPDGRVVDSSGRDLTLRELFGDKLVLLSFIYATCSDVNGCPLATAVLHRIQGRLKSEPVLAGQLRLISLSFDPEHDTPEVMEKYGEKFRGGLDWRFLTTRGPAEIEPILAAYDQSVQKDFAADGKFLGTYSHILRVYLIDREQRIRNIYTASYLHPDAVLNDIKTLLDERGPEPTAAAPATGAGTSPASAPGRRTGAPADLLEFALKPPLGLPKVPIPADNTLSTARVALGRKLFFDRRLSLNGTISCAMCHVPEQGFTSNEQATAVGIEGRSVRRNSPTLFNIAYAKRLFVDGRENQLEQQVWGPLLARNEMGAPSVGWVVDRLRGLADYVGLFEQAYGRGPTMETIGQAIASYERTLNSADSPFDRWFYGQRSTALNARAQLGATLFTGKAGCVACHRIDTDQALFTDHELHNTGIGYRASMVTAAQPQRIQTAPGVSLLLDAASLAAVSEPRPNDLGRYEVTQNPDDRWKFKTPSLRNIALTAPYMHDGSLSSLRDVVEFYNRGGAANPNLDPRIKPLGLGEREVDAIVEFLRALTGANVDTIVADALAAPVGDP